MKRFFSPTEVLLDNQASKSIFKNSNLLSNIRHEDPFFIGGIDGTSKGLKVSESGDFGGLGRVGLSRSAAANVLSKTQMLDGGKRVSYDQDEDVYRLTGGLSTYTFGRKILNNGRKSGHYACEMTDSAFIATVTNNMRRFTKQEVSRARNVRELMTRLAFSSSAAIISMINHGIMNSDVTAEDVHNADAIWGTGIEALKGKTNKKASIAATSVLAPRVTQVQQILTVDIFFVKKIPFLMGLFIPLNLAMCAHLKNRTGSVVAASIRTFLSTASSRGFDCVQLRSDGEGAVESMRSELNSCGITLDIAGPGQHVPAVERMIQSVKKRVRCYENSLPYVMTRLLLIMCVLFCVSRVNMQPSSTATDHVSPLEQFSGRKLDAKLDLRVGFGDYVHATVPVTDNTLSPRTQGCIAMLPTGTLTGSVKMWCLRHDSTVTRDQFVILPMPDMVASYITAIASSQGYQRGLDPDLGPLQDDDRDVNDELDALQLPQMMPIDGRAAGVHLADNDVVADAGVVDVVDAVAVENALVPRGAEVAELEHAIDDSPDEQHPIDDEQSIAESKGDFTSETTESTLQPPAARKRRGGLDSLQSLQGPSALLLNQLHRRSSWHDKDFAFTMSVRAALRERGEEAQSVITAELKQMCEKRVWHGVHTSTLTAKERMSIIRSSMFLKDKYLASGSFDRFKARLVAGGNMQDKSLYENLSSPTAATTSVLTVAAIAAAEGRKVVVIDIGGAFLNADMTPTGVVVHMRLDRIMSSMLIKIE